MSRKIRIGTRKSQLAMAQTNLVIEEIKKAEPDIEVEIVAISTKGDKILNKPLLSFGGKGVFVEEFESKIQNGEIDIAVHSAKDMPMDVAEGLTIVSVLKRADPRDALITKRDFIWRSDEPAVIGTSSLRRKMQIERYGKVECRDLRGNVNTRLQKLEDGEYDGILLAMAGLKRLGLDSDERFQIKPLPYEQFIPAGGQGIIAVEGRKDSILNDLFQKIEDFDTRTELLFERLVLKDLNAGCHEPIGVFSKIEDEMITGYLMQDNQIHQVKGSRQKYEELAAEISKAGRMKE